jgi:integrase
VIEDMPRPRPPYLSRERNRHGTSVWYVRIGGKRIRIRETYGTPEFDAAYQAALAGKATVKKAAPDAAAGTLKWLIDQYRDTAAWQNDLKKATRRQRDNIYNQVIAAAGNQPYTRIKKADIEKGRERRGATPHQARHFLDAMRGLFRWAHKKAKLIKLDPTAGVENPARPKSEGFEPWTEDEASAYEQYWPIGTRQRVWLDLPVYTGLRRGDATRVGRQHVRNGKIYLKTEKTGTPVALDILPVLAQTLAAGPCGDLTFIVGANGRPMTKESFGNAFREAAREAGINKSVHGLRKIAAIRCAQNGATVPQMNAIFGWTGERMALHYIELANREKMAADAMPLMNKNRTSIVAPKGKVRHLGRKPK